MHLYMSYDATFSNNLVLFVQSGVDDHLRSTYFSNVQSNLLIITFLLW